jgi:hypothetical protein
MADIESIARRNGILEIRKSSLSYINLDHGTAFWLLGTLLTKIIDGRVIETERIRNIVVELGYDLPDYEKHAVEMVNNFILHLLKNDKDIAFYKTNAAMMPEKRRLLLLEFVKLAIPN